jgi:hypothetical protein
METVPAPDCTVLGRSKLQEAKKGKNNMNAG